MNSFHFAKQIINSGRTFLIAPDDGFGPRMTFDFELRSTGRLKYNIILFTDEGPEEQILSDFISGFSYFQRVYDKSVPVDVYEKIFSSIFVE